MLKFYRNITLAAMALAAAGATAGETTFDYCPSPGAALKWWGTSSKETYDVAVQLKDPSLVGKTVNSVSIPFIAQNAQGVQVWLTTELALKKNDAGKKVNDANILTVDAQAADGFINVAFDQPYTITDSGVWVGYTFEITDKTAAEDQRPVAVYENADQPGGFWLHSSRRYMKWVDNNSSTGFASAMAVRVGGVEGVAAGLLEIPKCYAEAGEPTLLPVRIANHGNADITSIEYTYEVAGKSGTETVEFPAPLPTQFNVAVPVSLTLPAVADFGDHKGKVAITKVNGQPNTDPAPSREFDLSVISFVPTNRPVMEEYTGLWCGYCPRGFACLEQMNDIYGDAFIGVSFHNGDDMEFKDNVPASVAGFPDAIVNRTIEEDPSFSLIEPLWKQLRENFAIADITPRAWWTDDSHTSIHAEATSRFVSGESDADYRVAYILVQNGMSDPSWEQSNYYGGDTSYAGDPYMEPFVNGGKTVKGLVYNDVAIYSPNLAGTPESVPAKFEAGQNLTHGLDIAAADVVNVDGSLLIQHPDKLFLVTILLDANGAAVNSNRCAVAMDAPVAIQGLESGQNAQPVWYDLMGRRVANPQGGVFVKVQGGKAVKVAK